MSTNEDRPANSQLHLAARTREPRRRPDLAHKLDVLRGHCEREGRDYDEIEKTCYFIFDVGEKGEKAGEVVDRLGELAELGFHTAIGGVANVHQLTPLEVIGSQVIPAVASL